MQPPAAKAVQKWLKGAEEHGIPCMGFQADLPCVCVGMHNDEDAASRMLHV